MKKHSKMKLLFVGLALFVASMSVLLSNFYPYKDTLEQLSSSKEFTPRAKFPHGLHISYYSDIAQQKLLFSIVENDGNLAFSNNKWSQWQQFTQINSLQKSPEDIQTSLIETYIQVATSGKYFIVISPPSCFFTTATLDQQPIININTNSVIPIELSANKSYHLKLSITSFPEQADGISQAIINACFKELKILWKKEGAKLEIIPTEVLYLTTPSAEM